MAPDRIGLHLCLVLALAACGGGDEEAAAPAPPEATVPAATAASTAQADSAEAARIAAAKADTGAQAPKVLRETFAYGGGSRDPFESLLNLATAGPELPDLQLVAIYQDLAYNSNSVAVLRDRTNERRFRLRIGDQLGRLTVAQIRQKDVVFIVEDFGFERQETLSLTKREEETP